MYCPRDLCDRCEKVGGRDRTRFSVVAIAPVRSQLGAFGAELDLSLLLQADMNKFYYFTGMSAEDASGSPIMKYPVYRSCDTCCTRRIGHCIVVYCKT